LIGGRRLGRGLGGLLPFFGITCASIARGLVKVASLALTIIVLRRKKAVSIDLTTLWKTLVAGGFCYLL